MVLVHFLKRDASLSIFQFGYKAPMLMLFFQLFATGFKIIIECTGFQYIYLTRKRKFTRTEIRGNLRRLGVDPSRILDISFPARSCVCKVG